MSHESDALISQFNFSLNIFYRATLFAVITCRSVRPSVTSRYCIETTGRIELVFGMKASFYLCCKEIRVSPEIRVLPSGTLSETPDLDNFATESRSRCRLNETQCSVLRFSGHEQRRSDKAKRSSRHATPRKAVTCTGYVAYVIRQSALG